jgi:uncharacterized membrane protein HdeD (DUF308 family)
MMAAPARPLPDPWRAILLCGVVAVVLGLLALVWTSPTIVVAALSVGSYLLISGISQVSLAFGPIRSAAGRFMVFASGGASLVFAVAAFAQFHGAALLATWVGLSLFVQGVTTALSIISDRARPALAWDTFLGAVSMIAGIAVLASRGESLGRMTVIVGSWLTVMGVCGVVTALGIRSAYSRQRLGAVFGDLRMLCHEVGLMNPLARLIWRICKIDGPASRYRSEPQRTPLPAAITDDA